MDQLIKALKVLNTLYGVIIGEAISSLIMNLTHTECHLLLVLYHNYVKLNK